MAKRAMTTAAGVAKKILNKPISADELPRPGGIASMFRLPIQEGVKDLDACFVGVPMDIGTSNRPGTRFGPRYIRCESTLVRQCNKDTGAAPFESLNVADIGDIFCTSYNLPEAVKQIKDGVGDIIKDGCRPLVMGGDHTITYPILQAFKEKYGPVGLVHVDAHSDTSFDMCGAKITHGTPFRRAVEEGLLDCERVVQIGIRGSGYSVKDLQWAVEQGFRIVLASDCWYQSLAPLMEEVRQQMGDGPVYLSFDIDGLDPSFAPATGTPEIAGLTTIQGLEIIRGCRGLNILGADLVEVSPPYDTNGMTSSCAANLLFEMLCILPGVKYDEIVK